MTQLKTAIANSFNVQIWIGLKEGYDGDEHSIDEVYEIVQKYVNEVGQCFTVTPTKFIYKNGSENGVVVGLINYPRFPLENYQIIAHATQIAIDLGIAFRQNRVSITAPERTYMIEFSYNDEITK